jgi:uncharacterized protein (TIGR00725 family)
MSPAQVKQTLQLYREDETLVEDVCEKELRKGKPVVGVMGPVNASRSDIENAFKLGRLIARENWKLLSGGMASGVMKAVNAGAKLENGETVGILPGRTTEYAVPDLDTQVITGIGEARNSINALSSDVIIACGISAGTLTEIAFGIKGEKPVILLGIDKESTLPLQRLGGPNVQSALTPNHAVLLAKEALTSSLQRSLRMES